MWERSTEMVRGILLWLLIAMMTASISPAAAWPDETAKPFASNAVLWRDPGDIKSKDLFSGAAGKEGQPRGPFRFEGENTRGTNPKFDVRDGEDKKWTAKIGPEARPETVATRLLWAVGYFTNVDYFMDHLLVEGMPEHPTRGGDLIDKAGELFQARLQRKPGKDHHPWSFRNNPFRGTREFNGLRVMMALIHNWDIKDDNNAWYEDKETGHAIYYVSDLGSSFGTSGKSYSDVGSKSNLDAYRKTRFIAKITPDYVSFNFPTHPALYHIFNLPYFIHQMRNRWIGRNIPRQDVRWIASLLAQLTPAQIRDAFRAAGYTPEQVEGFSAVVQSRIAELSKL